MKYSNYIGVVIAVMLIAVCFMPWVYIQSIHTTVTGMMTEHTNFGKPGIINIFLSFMAIGLFIIPRVWAKRTNLFIGFLNLAWAARNFLIITRCEIGECPEKQPGIYLMLALSAALLLMTLLPADKRKD